jgi:hypothetical protein
VSPGGPLREAKRWSAQSSVRLAKGNRKIRELPIAPPPARSLTPALGLKGHGKNPAGKASWSSRIPGWAIACRTEDCADHLFTVSYHPANSASHGRGSSGAHRAATLESLWHPARGNLVEVLCLFACFPKGGTPSSCHPWAPCGNRVAVHGAGCFQGKDMRRRFVRLKLRFGLPPRDLESRAIHCVFSSSLAKIFDPAEGSSTGSHPSSSAGIGSVELSKSVWVQPVRSSEAFTFQTRSVFEAS